MSERKDPATPNDSSSFDAFRDLAARLVQVPKTEADEKEVEYQRDREKEPKRGPKSA